MKKFDIRDVLNSLLVLIISMVAFLGGLYLMGWMIELIATNIQPEIITVVCVALATVVIKAQC